MTEHNCASCTRKHDDEMLARILSGCSDDVIRKIARIALLAVHDKSDQLTLSLLVGHTLSGSTITGPSGCDKTALEWLGRDALYAWSMAVLGVKP
jgi:hypothetical protein